MKLFRDIGFYFSLLLLILIFGNFTYCQEIKNCNFSSSFASNTGGILIKEQISKQEFDSISQEEFNLPSELEIQYFLTPKESEKRLIEEFPEVFKKTNNGYDFLSLKGDTLSVRNTLKKLELHDKGATTYQFKGRLKNHIVISWRGYEEWGYVIVDVNHNIAFELPGVPKFISSKLVYAHTNYYGQAVIKFINLETGKDVTVSYEDTFIKKIIDLPYEQLALKLERGNCKNMVDWKFSLFSL